MLLRRDSRDSWAIDLQSNFVYTCKSSFLERRHQSSDPYLLPSRPNFLYSAIGSTSWSWRANYTSVSANASIFSIIRGVGKELHVDFRMFHMFVWILKADIAVLFSVYVDDYNVAVFEPVSFITSMSTRIFEKFYNLRLDITSRHHWPLGLWHI